MSTPSTAQTGQKLTKKEKKALAFRQNKSGANKGKEKIVLNEEDAVPEAEDVNMAEVDREKVLAKKGGDKDKGKGKKRAREDEEGAQGEGTGGDTEGEGDGAEDEQPKKKKRQRGKTPAQRAREQREREREQQGAVGEGGTVEGDAAKGGARLLLFVGNLPYKVTVEEIQKHFSEACGETPAVRLLTAKTPSTSQSTTTQPPSKGCCFLEFPSTSGTALQSALRLHHSTLLNRKINVELTAGGGGNSEARKAKIEGQRKKMEEEREKALKNKRLKEGEGEDGDKRGRWKLAAEKKAAAGGAEAEGEAAGGEGEAGKGKKKVRDRRLKGTQPGTAAPAVAKKEKEQKLPKASSGANAIKLASGWGNKAGK
ncbi:hypothetical protein JCM11641_002282 [Rhodosporidiobolus odoratus]